MGELYNPYPKLPKNIRQIGDRDSIVKLYLEDYVNTYLSRLYPVGGQDLRAGLLLGNMETHDGTPYIFIDGAMEMEGVTREGEKVEFTEGAWKKAYQNVEAMFPKRTIMGWFLCGAPGSQLSPLNYWKQHVQYFQGPNQLMYLNSGLEGEESIYITSEDGFYKLRGHCVYYERNQMMQDYMVLRKDVRRVETGGNDAVIRDFRYRMDVKKDVVSEKRRTISLLGGVSSAMAIVILAGAIVMFNNYERMKDMESVIASALPDGIQTVIEGKDKSKTSEEPVVIVEEEPGNVYPTQQTQKETMSPAAPQGASKTPETQAGESDRPVETQPQAAKQTKAESAAAADSEVLSEDGKKYYVVQDGETLYGICIKLYQDMSLLDEICELNGLEDENKIISGQKLLLP